MTETLFLPKVLVFDWDGTLIDSAGRIVDCLRAAALEIGLRDLEDACYRDIIGLGLQQAIARLYPDLDPAGAERFREGYSKHFIAADVEPSRFFPGVMPTLEALRSRGHTLAVATGKSRRGLDRVLDSLGLVGFFDATRCADETASKPDPRMVHELLVELEVEPADALIVGDTEYDLAMAARAGVRSVGVSYGVHSPERLRQHGPIAIVDSFGELLRWPVSGLPQHRSTER